MNKFKLILILLIFTSTIYAQNKVYDSFFENYEDFKESSLNQRRIKRSDIEPLINALKNEADFKVTHLGKSIEGRNISLISLGKGKTNVLLWSQMHGDESTATMAIFDLLNYLKKNKDLLSKIKIHFLPMLNPDGAELFTRRNAIGIDLNRDALRLQTPEAKILKRVRDSLNADFGFNLHDQSKYYNANLTPKQATISYLAPAYNYEKDINEVRGNAMKIIAEMNTVIQKYAPGQVGKYSDDFEPRAFGDNIQKWGTSTILIESGGFKDDPEKQFIRKLNYVSILAAITSIANQTYKNIPLSKYESIPKNDRKLFDLKIEKLTFEYLGNNYTVDLGINHFERDNKDHTNFYYIGRIVEIGDLSTYYGYSNINGIGLEFKQGKTYPKIVNLNELDHLDFEDILKQGFSSIAVQDLPEDVKFTEYPVNLVNIKNMTINNQPQTKSPLQLGNNPTFFIVSNNQVVYAIINGFVYDLQSKNNEIKNGITK